jgi:hypothetical protein
VKKTLIAVVVLSCLAGVANAGSSSFRPYRGGWYPQRVRAPEINPASAASALTLLLGGLTVLRSRVGKK